MKLSSVDFLANQMAVKNRRGKNSREKGLARKNGGEKPSEEKIDGKRPSGEK